MKNYYKKLKGIENGKKVIKFILETIGFFLATFIIIFVIVVALSPANGGLEGKFKSVIDYIKIYAGIKVEEPKPVENTILTEASFNPEKATETKISASENVEIPVSENVQQMQVAPAAAQTEVPSAVQSNVSAQETAVRPVGNSWYYSQLSPVAQIFYDRLSKESAYFLKGEHIFEFGTVFNDLAQTPEGREQLKTEFNNAVVALVMDYQQLYFVEVRNITLVIKGVSYLGLAPVYTVDVKNADGKKFYVDGIETEEQVNELRRLVETERERVIREIAAKSRNEYEIIKNVHDYVVQRVEYDTVSTGPHKHTLYEALLNGKAVCEGYAELVKYLLDGFGIESIIAVGDGLTPTEIQSHAWNYIKMSDGKWYAMDATWDDPIKTHASHYSLPINYTYFLVGKNEFVHNHRETGAVSEIPNGKIFTYPEISITKYRR